MASEAVSVVHTDLEGKIIFMSQGSEDLFQYNSEELVDKERVSVFSPGLVVLEHVPRWLKQSVKEGHFETDTAFIRKDGSRFAARIRITPIVKDGMHTGYIGVTRPLNELTPDEVMPHTSLKIRLMSWLYVTRAPFLTVTIVPVLLGALLAPWLASGTTVDIGLALLTLLGASLAHLGVNSANDYFDWRSGVDAANVDYVVPYSGGSRMIQLGVIGSRGMLWTFLVLLGLAGVVGAYVATAASVWPEAAIVALAGGGLGIFYSAPPVKLAARGFGEIGIFLAFGPLIVAGVVLVQTGALFPEAFLAGIPVGLLTAAIVWVNEFPDAAGDEIGGKRTLVVRLGLEKARWGYPIICLVAYTFIGILAIAEVVPVQGLLGLLAVPLAAYAISLLFRHYRLRSIKKAMAMTIYLHLATGFLMVAGFALAL